MKYILPAALMLFSIAVLATGGAQSMRTTDMDKAVNAQQEAVDRQNKSAAMMGTGSGQEYQEKKSKTKETESKIPKTDHNKEEE